MDSPHWTVSGVASIRVGRVGCVGYAPEILGDYILLWETVVLKVQVLVVPRKVGVASCVAGHILRKVRHTFTVPVLLLRDSLKTVLKILVFRLLEDPQHPELKVEKQAGRVVGIRGMIGRI